MLQLLTLEDSYKQPLLCFQVMLFCIFSDFFLIKRSVIKDFSPITRAEYMNVVLYLKKDSSRNKNSQHSNSKGVG